VPQGSGFLPGNRATSLAGIMRGISLSLFPFHLSLSAPSCSRVINVSANAPLVQAIHSHTDMGDRKQAIYNLFTAYIHTIPLEERIKNVERARLDAKLRYVVI
jgi:hypothetical protein